MMFEPSLTKGVLEVFSPVHSALSAADEQATKAIDIQHANIHGESREDPPRRTFTVKPVCEIQAKLTRLPLCRCGRFQRVGVFWKPGLLLHLRLFCGQRCHSDPRGPVQPGGAVRDPAGPHHLLAEPAEGPHPAAGKHL